MDSDYSFQVYCELPWLARLSGDITSYSITPTGWPVAIRMVSSKRDQAISEAENLFFRASGWTSEQEARKRGEAVRAALTRAFARVRSAVDFGDDTPQSMVFPAVLEPLSEKTGRPVLNHRPGIVVYPTDPAPLFVASGPATGRRVPTVEQFGKALTRALELDLKIDDRVKTAFNLYSASFASVRADTRLLLLFQAIEVLKTQGDRSAAAIQLVDSFICDAEQAELDDPDEQKSLIGTLKWLRKESVRQAGLRLMSTLGDREYGGRSPSALFDLAYDLRNRLVHGHLPRPSRSETGSVSANLEILVADLLAGPLLSEDI